ncbi:MAG TPA: aspartate aminotransferase family protein [Chloroflexi bacterium]|nr:aspartate aminotransferase family protein [Chloroflexota bacterium]
MDTQALESRYTSGLYTKRPLTIVRGQGALVWDDQGRAYIDCVAGHGVANIGHSHPKVVEALRAQAERIITCPEMFYNDTRARLLERLGNLVPGMERVFLCNSGTEAVEAAIKFARFSTGRAGIVAAMRGFHGRTLGSLSATWNKKYRAPFQPLVPEFSHIPYNKPAALREAVTENTAAVLLEAVQGEGGIHPATPEFLQTAQEICRERGALLIIDEIQSGMGRTGKMFAFQHSGVQPDLVTLAKGIAGGVPMGAVLIGERVAPLKPGIHGTTFGGNPLAAAASLATLDVLEGENLPQRAAETGAYFLERLRSIQNPLIREVRGAGLMIGVELKQKVAPVIQGLMAHGVLALPAGMTVVRFLPPLVITTAQIDTVVAAFKATLEDVAG